MKRISIQVIKTYIVEAESVDAAYEMPTTEIEVAGDLQDVTTDYAEVVEDLDEEPTEPEEGDWTTEDHRIFYSYGRVILNLSALSDEEIERSGGLWAHIERGMERDQFWPSVWFISDHGNAHLMSRETA